MTTEIKIKGAAPEAPGPEAAERPIDLNLGALGVGGDLRRQYFLTEGADVKFPEYLFRQSLDLSGTSYTNDELQNLIDGLSPEIKRMLDRLDIAQTPEDMDKALEGYFGNPER
jgi:hypothetical protein